jgi:hypothetical protein
VVPGFLETSLDGVERVKGAINRKTGNSAGLKKVGGRLGQPRQRLEGNRCLSRTIRDLVQSEDTNGPCSRDSVIGVQWMWRRLRSR